MNKNFKHFIVAVCVCVWEREREREREISCKVFICIKDILKWCDWLLSFFYQKHRDNCMKSNEKLKIFGNILKWKSHIKIPVLTLDAGLLARSQYPEGPATGHLDTGFSWFPCVYKRMLRWFPSFQVATTCLSCSPPDLNFLVTFFSYLCTCKNNRCRRVITQLQLIDIIIIINLFTIETAFEINMISTVERQLPEVLLPIFFAPSSTAVTAKIHRIPSMHFYIMQNWFLQLDHALVKMFGIGVFVEPGLSKRRRRKTLTYSICFQNCGYCDRFLRRHVDLVPGICQALVYVILV